MKDQATILIVDDERGPRESLKMILKDEYDLLMACDGKEAVEILQTHPVDLVISDIKMPELSGIGVLKKVKELDPTIEVILLTGYGTLDGAKSAAKHKVFDYIGKPYDIQKIREVVKRGIEKKRCLKKDHS